MVPLAEGAGRSAGDCPAVLDPIADDMVAPLINGAAKTHSAEPKLIRALIEQQSGFRP